MDRLSRNTLILLEILYLVTRVLSRGSLEDEVTDSVVPFIENDQVELLFESTTIQSLEDEKSSEEELKNKPFLLPETVFPSRYDLQIVPILNEDLPLVEDPRSIYYNLSRFDAPGEVWIYLKCIEETDYITLHAHHDIRIQEGHIRVIGDDHLNVKNVSRDNDTDFLVIHLKETICQDLTESSEIILNIKFVARIASDRLNGLYLDYYNDPETKEKRYLSTTLFAPNHARKAFPCFDEPKFKANFSISIGRKSDDAYSSISNMPLISREDGTLEEIDGFGGAYVWDRFETSPPIATYIVAMITTDFPSRSIKHDDVDVRLHAPAYLLDRTVKLNVTNSFVKAEQNPHMLQDPLIFIESALHTWRKLGVDYPLKKLDIIALPHFFFNAMENIGAITFKYPVILNIENVTTASELLRLNFVAGHEIAHQWFGNILTPSSWTYVWLKESFSDYFGRRLVALRMYGHENNEGFLNNEIQVALRYDQSANTHPLENIIRSAAEVGEIYTDIPYRKGASIVHMISSFLQNQTFMKSLESLILERKYGNVDQTELFHTLERFQKERGILESQGLDPNVTIKDILDTWSKQCGYPVVTVKKENDFHILQQKFYISDPFQSSLLNKTFVEENQLSKNKCINESNLDRYWWIPIKLLTSEDHKFHKDSIVWMPPNENEFRVDVNKGQVSNINGYFRILYSEELLISILNDWRGHHEVEKYPAYTITSTRGNSGKKILDPMERSQLLDDYFTFAFFLNPEGKVPVSLLFDIMSSILAYESEQVVWNTFFSNMKLPMKLLKETEYFPPLHEYMLHLLKPFWHFLESQILVVSGPCFQNPIALTRKMKLVQMKSIILQWMCELDADECTNLAKVSMKKIMTYEDSSLIPPDYQSALYCAAVRTADESELELMWDFFEKLYFKEYYSVQKERYLKALACAREEKYLKRMLSWTTNETIDMHDVERVTLLKYVIGNPKGRAGILDFISDNFKILYKSASVANPVTEAVKALAEYINTPEKLEKMESFTKKHATEMEKKKRFLDKQIRNAKLNLLWVQKVSQDISKSAELHVKPDSRVKQNSCANINFDHYLEKH